MFYKVEDIDGITLLTAYLSRATLDHAIDFKEYITKAIDDGRINIVIDFQFLEFIDSTFLGVLVLALKKITSLGGNLILVMNNEIPLDMMRLTNMDNVFKIFPNVEEAISSLKNSKGDETSKI